MKQTELEQLSREVAAKRGCDANSEYMQHGFKSTPTGKWLHQDSAFCFELMVSEKFITEHDREYDYVGIYHSEDQDKIVYEYYADHNNDASKATRVAILKAYLAKGE